MKKYRIVFRNAAQGQLQNHAVLIMRLIFLTVLVFTTEKLWQAIGHKGFDPVDIVWYLTFNELLLFSYDEKMRNKIFNDIRSGNIGYSLIRPFSYFKQCVVEGMGLSAVRLPILALFGPVLAYSMTGGFPSTFHGAACVFVLMSVASLLINLCIISIGLVGLYMQANFSLYIMWQKFLFVFGGLFFPLTIYPEWLQDIAAATPFPYMLYETSRLVYEFSWPVAWNTAVHLVLWTAAVFLLSVWLFGLLLKKVSVNGG